MRECAVGVVVKSALEVDGLKHRSREEGMGGTYLCLPTWMCTRQSPDLDVLQ